MSSHHRKVRWEEMFPDELWQAIHSHPVCYLAYGLAEPHGPYNALGLDWLKATALVERAAHEHGGVVAPPMAWHIHEVPEFHDDGKGKGWLVDVGVKQSLCSSLPADLFYRTVLYQVRAVDARGFRAAVLVTGHYGGLERTLRMLCDYYRRRTRSPIQLCAVADWELIRHESIRGDHAGRTETSQLMALQPDLVDLDRQSVPPELGTRFAAGVGFDDPERMPSRELGEKIIASQIQRLGELKDELLASYQPVDDWKAPSFNEVEAIWDDFDRLTRRYWSITYEQHKNKQVPVFPGWDALGA